MCNVAMLIERSVKKRMSEVRPATESSCEISFQSFYSIKGRDHTITLYMFVCICVCMGVCCCSENKLNVNPLCIFNIPNPMADSIGITEMKAEANKSRYESLKLQSTFSQVLHLRGLSHMNLY